jgi:hypothetical protein
LVIYLNCTMMHRLTNLQFTNLLLYLHSLLSVRTVDP